LSSRAERQKLFALLLNRYYRKKGK
jgi:hypothetical protein